MKKVRLRIPEGFPAFKPLDPDRTEARLQTPASHSEYFPLCYATSE